MKKIILTAIVALAIASCKKETVAPVQPAQSARSLDQQAADLIQLADADLYTTIYNRNPNERAPKPSVKYCPGIFVIQQGDPESGTCYTSSNVCFVIISWPKFVDENSSNPIEILADIHEEYMEEGGQSELILNTSPSPTTIEDVKSFDLEFDKISGLPVFSYSTL